MTKQLVLIGGGHAHMVTLANLHKFIEKGYGVTVIQPSEHHYYSGMGPGMLGGTYHPDDIRFATRKHVEAQGGRFILGKAYRIDPHKQQVLLEEANEGAGKEIAYDVLSCNAGSYVPREIVKGDSTNIFTAKPIENLLVAKEKIIELSAAKKITIAIIGSGPSAVEIAGNIHQLCREQKGEMPSIQLFGGRNFMSGKSRISRLVRTILERKGVEIIQAGRVQQIKDGSVVLENGQSYQADLFFSAVGVKPSQIFARSGLPIGSDGGLLVDKFLRSSRYSNIFGGGDCICFEPEPLDKVGVYAVRQNQVLYKNLMACLDGKKELEEFTPGGKYLLIYNLGEGDGVLSKWSFTFSGKLAFRIKDYIDRRFIQSFQYA
ncbi:MAG: FAD-dependent oxidoreductase [Desulforhopalus sp.]